MRNVSRGIDNLYMRILSVKIGYGLTCWRGNAQRYGGNILMVNVISKLLYWLRLGVMSASISGASKFKSIKYYTKEKNKRNKYRDRRN